MSMNERAETTPILREIESVWEKEGLDAVDIVEAAEPTPATEQSASRQATIPQHLMVLLQRLMQEHCHAETNQQEQAADLFRANDPATANRPEAVQPLSREPSSINRRQPLTQIANDWARFPIECIGLCRYP